MLDLRLWEFPVWKLAAEMLLWCFTPPKLMFFFDRENIWAPKKGFDSHGRNPWIVMVNIWLIYGWYMVTIDFFSAITCPLPSAPAPAPLFRNRPAFRSSSCPWWTWSIPKRSDGIRPGPWWSALINGARGPTMGPWDLSWYVVALWTSPPLMGHMGWGSIDFPLICRSSWLEHGGHRGHGGHVIFQYQFSLGESTKTIVEFLKVVMDGPLSQIGLGEKSTGEKIHMWGLKHIKTLIIFQWKFLPESIHWRGYFMEYSNLTTLNLQVNWNTAYMRAVDPAIAGGLCCLFFFWLTVMKREGKLRSIVAGCGFGFMSARMRVSRVLRVVH